jgi:nicotinate-nucleotide adenylyltransferase
VNQHRSCIAILGGAFDPVHLGHVAAAELICRDLQPTQLRLIPTGLSRQKLAAHALPTQRIAMLLLAFGDLARKIRLVVDDQEIRRAETGLASYSVETLTNIRFEYGADAALVLVIGADQLLNLQHWKNWEQLFDLAHIAVVSRPGFDLDLLDSQVAYEFGRRSASLTDMRRSPAGHTCLCDHLDMDVSSSTIREQLAAGIEPVPQMTENGAGGMAPVVLDYILQHHLYREPT